MMTKQKTSADGKGRVADVVKTVLDDKELRDLEKELGAFDDDSTKSIKDIAVQPINAIILILQGDRRTGTTGLDDQRATVRQQIAVAMELKEKNEAKQLKENYAKILKRENVYLRRLAEHLAKADYIRDNVATWVGIYENFWPRLSSVLKDKHGVDVSSLLEQARDIIEEQRARLRADKQEEEEDPSGEVA